MNKRQKGFSLVELSVVLVIIGLLVASVVGGDALIKSMELKSTLTQVEEYKTSLDQFKYVYSGFPGDITDATDYWSSASNGDGNEQIADENSNEAFQALYQLELSDFINVPGTLSGTWGNAFVITTEGVTGNVATTEGDRLIYIRCCSDADYARSISFNNHINIFTIYPSNDDYRAGAFTPIEAFNIDTKIDDGIPDFGFVGASAGYNGTGYSISNACYLSGGNLSTYQSADATYKDERGCQMQFAYDWD